MHQRWRPGKETGDAAIEGESSVPGTDRTPGTAGTEPTVVVMDNRNEIRDFLISRRARITPEWAGLPACGGTRRAAGLRREEVTLSPKSASTTTPDLTYWPLALPGARPDEGIPISSGSVPARLQAAGC